MTKIMRFNVNYNHSLKGGLKTMFNIENKKEIFCNSCTHSSTCKYKDTYLKVDNALQETFENFDNLEMKETDFMNFKHPSCKYFSNISLVPGSNNYRNN